MAAHWKEINLLVPGSVAEKLSEQALTCGAVSASLEDANADTPDEYPLYGEPNMPTTDNWPTSRLCLLIPYSIDTKKFLLDIQAEEECPYLFDYNEQPIDEKDWVLATQAEFNTIIISERLRISPSWHATDCTDSIQIILDPGLAFGTGSHPTTALCLEWLDNFFYKNKKQASASVLDYGCGSGILAIAAKKLGATECYGVDIDPQALIAAKQNAINNQIDNVTFLAPEQRPNHEFDIVIANILANPIIKMAEELADAVIPNGWLILSGILIEQAQSVIDAYNPWIEITIDKIESGWVRLVGNKSKDKGIEWHKS